MLFFLNKWDDLPSIPALRCSRQFFSHPEEAGWNWPGATVVPYNDCDLVSKLR